MTARPKTDRPNEASESRSLGDVLHSGWSALGTACRRFARDQRGVVAVYFVLAMIPISAAAGAAIDISRAYMVKNRLGTAIDAAGLAVGASHGASEAELQQVLVSYFNANYPTDEIGVPATPQMIIEGSKITISVSASVDTTLMRVVQINSITVDATTEIIRETKGLDVVLVLDNTGSMNGSRLRSLKAASKQFMDIIFGDDSEPEDLLVGIVPFASAVNVGTANSFATAFTTELPEDSEFEPDTWGGCLEARAAPHDQQDTDIDNGGRWTRYLWPHSSGRNNWNRLNPRDDVSPHYGPNKQCPAELLPLTNVKQTLIDKIDEMEANGITHINIGAIWGLRVISPTAPFTNGHAFDDEDYNKAVVIMTDGQNTINAGCGNYSAYGSLCDARLGYRNAADAREELDRRLIEICDNIRATGTLVYTITFQVGSVHVRELMRECADDGKYFNSPNDSELEKTFQAIGAELSNLRIGK